MIILWYLIVIHFGIPIILCIVDSNRYYRFHPKYMIPFIGIGLYIFDYLQKQK